MSGITQGADVDGLLRLAEVFASSARRLEYARDELSAGLRSVRWSGADAAGVHQRWVVQSQLIGSAAELLTAYAGIVARNRAEQVQASGSGGPGVTSVAPFVLPYAPPASIFDRAVAGEVFALTAKRAEKVLGFYDKVAKPTEWVGRLFSLGQLSFRGPSQFLESVGPWWKTGEAFVESQLAASSPVTQSLMHTMKIVGKVAPFVGSALSFYELYKDFHSGERDNWATAKKWADGIAGTCYLVGGVAALLPEPAASKGVAAVALGIAGMASLASLYIEHHEAINGFVSRGFGSVQQLVSDLSADSAAGPELSGAGVGGAGGNAW